MARELNPGDKVNGYVISQFLNKGFNATSYLAEKNGVKYFFKQYSKPSPLQKNWYEPYVKYQDSIKQAIIRDPLVKEYCSDLYDFFTVEEKRYRAYYQVLEYFPEGESLKECLDSQRLSWENRVICAKTLMSGMTRLHEAGVIHSDLKTDNLYLIPNKKRAGFYWTKIIDFDFSILSDEQAPWHGISGEGYVGTPRYLSPEHFRGQVPQFKSDVFTCGIILYELLTKQGHPYDFDNAEDYARNVERYTAQEPSLRGTFGDRDHDKRVCAILRQMLAPKLEDRPSAAEVRIVLLGK